MSSRYRLLALTVAASLAGGTASAAPPPSSGSAKSGTVMRRTALIVRDMNTALQFYRDALGLKVVDDRTKRMPDGARTDADSTSVTRIVLFGSTDDYSGQLELIAFVKPVSAPLPLPADGKRHPGSAAMLFSTSDVSATFARAKAVPGTRVEGEPHPYTYPAYSGVGTTTEIFGYIYDPDGNFVEINQPANPR